MIRQYPHTMVVSSVTTSSTQNSSGDFVQGSSTVAAEVACRYETRDSSGYVQSDVGIKIRYDAIIYLPLPAADVKIGSRVSVRDNGVEIASDTVKHFLRGQLNARVWL